MSYVIGGVEKETDADGYLKEPDFSDEAVQVITAADGIALTEDHAHASEGWSREIAAAFERIRAADAAGVDTVWVAESWGEDAAGMVLDPRVGLHLHMATLRRQYPSSLMGRPKAIGQAHLQGRARLHAHGWSSG